MDSLTSDQLPENCDKDMLDKIKKNFEVRLETVQARIEWHLALLMTNYPQNQDAIYKFDGFDLK